MIPFEFIDDVMSLKRVPRNGWITCGVGKCDLESVASHTYSVAVLALVMSETVRVSKQRVDVEKVLKMGLLHDLSESMTFDISKAYLRYLGKAGKTVKTRLEQKAISRILADLDNKPIAKVLGDIIKEYASQKSLEARIVHCADAIDLLLQVIEYERMGYSSTMFDSIWKETKSRLIEYGFPLANEWSRKLERVRQSLRGKHGLQRSNR